MEVADLELADYDLRVNSAETIQPPLNTLVTALYTLPTAADVAGAGLLL